MATPAELQAKIERERLELVALRNKAAALPDGPERDAVQAQRDALRAQQKTTTRELEVATSQSPAIGQFEGVDANSGQYRYKNPDHNWLKSLSPHQCKKLTLHSLILDHQLQRQLMLMLVKRITIQPA